MKQKKKLKLNYINSFVLLESSLISFSNVFIGLIIVNRTQNGSHSVTI